ncbi:hypothetical protein CEXT_520091 [Caerostris extrusa]|uniref:Uncharacterized protein n=1 Tax=Caerostris extrusa TaxID=172846 RepID=A0AAV4N6A3_CAEEX|nr:hypothetical protein CEXT_520091 [Caerostris extrusa]
MCAHSLAHSVEKGYNNSNVVVKITTPFLLSLFRLNDNSREGRKHRTQTLYGYNKLLWMRNSNLCLDRNDTHRWKTHVKDPIIVGKVFREELVCRFIIASVALACSKFSNSFSECSRKKAQAQSLIKVERDVDFGRFCNPIYVYNASNQRARRRAVQRSKFKQPFPVNLQGSTGYSFSKFMQNFCAAIYNCSSGV